MKFAVLFIFGTDVIGDAPYAAFSDDTNVKTVIFKDFSWRSTRFIFCQKYLLEFLSKIDPCIRNTVDIRVLRSNCCCSSVKIFLLMKSSISVIRISHLEEGVQEKGVT